MLNTPPILLGAALLLWGWQTDMPVFGAMMAAVLEASRLVRFRFDFSRADMCRVWDLCCLLTILAGFYCVMTRDSLNEVAIFFRTLNLSERPMAATQLAGAAKLFFQWWPMLLFLTVLAQAYGRIDRLPATVYSVIMRRRLRREGIEPKPGSGANFGFPYAAVCVYSSSLTLQNAGVFYWCFAGLCIWGLHAVRPRRFPLLTWSLVVVMLVMAGFVAQREFPRAAASLEGRFIGLFWKWLRKQQVDGGFDTSIGHVSGLKGSGGIVMRMETRGRPPELLPESVFCRFDGERWDNPMWMAYEDVPPQLDGETWVLSEGEEATNSLLIARQFGSRMRGVARPRSTSVLMQMPVEKFTTNALGSIRAGRGAPFIVYRTSFGLNQPAEIPPILPMDVRITSPDLVVPEFEDLALARVAEEIGLRWGQDTEKMVAAISRFFAEKFEYSLEDLPNRRISGEEGQTLIGRFLLDARRGHCEYFATSTALLLRHLGVPTRYVLGWAVQERGDEPYQYLVRSRHAHAWIRYWSDTENRWRVLDPTPAAGFDADLNTASWFEPIGDWWSGRMHDFRMWRYYGGNGAWQNYLLAGLLVLLGLWGLRIFIRRHRILGDDQPGSVRVVRRLGLDSDLYEIDRRLAAIGLSRRQGETWQDWVARIDSRSELHPELLREMISMHYRYRFDPEGLSGIERDRLRDVARRWTSVFAGKPKAG